MEKKQIHIKGARVNNLQNIDLDIPLGKLVVITGISGSGKSSLAFDTLFAEGQRRFAESLSAFARQFLGRMSKPDVDLISGIPPAIAIEQKVNTRNPRSTVGTTTEIYDHLRLLFAKIGKTYSPVSGQEVRCDTARGVVDYITSLPEGTTALILADIRWKDGGNIEKLLNLKEEGFTRIATREGRYAKMEEALQNIGDFADEQLLLVDRLTVARDEDTVSRALDSVQTAFAKGEGYISIWSQENGARNFSSIFEADGIRFEEPSEQLFSYNSPLGACPVCGGYGKTIGIDESLVIPDPTLSVYQGAIACWRGEMMKQLNDNLIMNAARFGFPIHRPYIELTPEQKKVLWEGNEFFIGIDQFFKWVESQRYKVQYRYMLSRYSGKTTCHACGGSRLRKEALYVKVGGKDIYELMTMPISKLEEFFNGLQLDDYDRALAERPLREIGSRLRYICEVGLGYLTLSRASNTLSGGESQRINLVSCLGNNLTGSMYILDEPSIGLHERDTERLIGVLKRLRDLGNTVIVVEHDRNIIEAADQLIDIGPLAGKEGGRIVFQGTVTDGIARGAQSLTLDYLTGARKLPLREKRSWKYAVEVVGARENNLKNIDVKFPLRVLTVVTGVSGSGKSSLVGDILYPALYRHINQLGNKPGIFKELRGDLSKISSVEYIDQNPIGKSTRSNPVTYLKVYDDIRRLYSEQPYAKMNGYGHSHFSFNIDGGRCPECLGEGVIHIPMQFMADVEMVCEACGGRRFQSDILEVKYQGMDISQVLDMSVKDAIAFFGSQSEPLARRIAERLQPLVDVGLSYLSLGQSSSSLSGGESQRIKLASFLAKDYDARGSILFVFDEPTTGLHFHDIAKLLKCFDALVARGHSIVVVEHNLDVIRAADWVIDLGPEAGGEGGSVVFEGTPEELAGADTYTGRALKSMTI
ncbi:MAG: excinuclease ABC subunit UvrA [Bacteroidales bacterium]|nr:excinuclease ABC subunit UvrA [Bacteroidales bacterium]